MVVTVEDLVVEYTSGDYVVRPIDKLDLQADAGQLVLLLGASGCGKTTLLSVLAAILKPTSGRVRVGGSDVVGLGGSDLTEYRRRGVGIVFQAFNLVPSLNAIQNVGAPFRAAGGSRSAARRRASELLDRVGLAERADHQPHRLSGGQQQRVAIARALVNDPPVLLADEPTAHLDYVQVDGVLSLIRDLVAEGRTILVATHDERMIPLADQVVHLTPRETVAPEAPILDLASGELLFEQGAVSDFVYTVEDGQIVLFRPLVDGREEVIGTVEPGQYFGEIGPTLGLRRSASARAAVPTRLSALSLADFRARVQAESS
jgi:putative ABC transport system ATP-binding protein